MTSITVRRLAWLVGSALLTTSCTTTAGGTTSSSAAAGASGSVAGASSGATQSPGSSTGGANAGQSASGTVVFMLPNTTTARFPEHDGPEFVKAMKELAPNVTVQVVNANNSQQTQVQQAENAISQGAKALVVVAADPATAGGLMAKAKAASVPVIDYEHGVSNDAITYHVQNSPEKVGEANGRTFADAIAKMSGAVRVQRLYGNKGDDYTTNEKKGQDKFVQPLIDKGKIKVVCEDYVANWQPSVAQQLTEQCLTRTSNGMTAILAMNDGTAIGAVAALGGQSLSGKIPVYGGQDAGLEALQYMLRGWIQDSVYKPFYAEAKAAAQLTIAAMTKTEPPSGLLNATFSDGKPMAYLDVVDLTPANLSKVVEDKLYTKVQLCAASVKDVTGFCTK